MPMALKTLAFNWLSATMAPVALLVWLFFGGWWYPPILPPLSGWYSAWSTDKHPVIFDDFLSSSPLTAGNHHAASTNQSAW